MLEKTQQKKEIRKYQVKELYRIYKLLNSHLTHNTTQYSYTQPPFIIFSTI